MTAPEFHWQNLLFAVLPLLEIRIQRIFSIAIWTICSFKEQHIYSHSKAYNRNQAQEPKPPGLIQVMQPTDSQGNGTNSHRDVQYSNEDC